jgi:hypothetical protein
VIQEGTHLKLANLTRALGRTTVVFATAAFLLPGCDSSDDTPAETMSEGSGSTDPSTSGETDPSDGSSTTDDSATDSETSGVGTTTGTPVEGLGCDPPPACDKGEYDGSITVNDQTTIDEIAGYTSITGRLAVANSDVECLEFLSCMTSVGHDLNLFGNDLLTDVGGLDNIEEIGAIQDGPLMPGGTLTISENNALVDFDSLNKLQQTPINFSISENDALESITGFQGMVGSQKNFEIRFNEQLRTVSQGGLGDILFIGGECVVTNNPNLCITTIVEMCETGVKQGPFGGNTANNDESC